MREVARDRHAWILSFLYVGTFGSFIGFGFAFGQVLQVQFGETFDSPMRVVGLTFLGPLLGSLFRPVRRQARRPLRRVPRHARSCSPRWRPPRAVVLAASRIDSLALFVAALRRHLRPQRARQRLDVQDDPGDLPGQGGARRRRRRATPTPPTARPGARRGRSSASPARSARSAASPSTSRCASRSSATARPTPRTACSSRSSSSASPSPGSRTADRRRRRLEGV